MRNETESTSTLDFEDEILNFTNDTANLNFNPNFLPNTSEPMIENTFYAIETENNTESDVELLEPLFSDIPSVSHKYTTRRKDFCLIDIGGEFDVDNIVDIMVPSCNMCVDNVTCFNIFGICEYCATVSTLSEGTTANSETDYSNFYNHLNLFIQSAKFISVRSYAETDRWGQHGMWYEELYYFSEWKKFTKSRPKTTIFSKSGTFTYDELPSFLLEKGKIRKHKKNKIPAVVPNLMSCRSNLTH